MVVVVFAMDAVAGGVDNVRLWDRHAGGALVVVVVVVVVVVGFGLDVADVGRKAATPQFLLVQGNASTIRATRITG
jgi:hypothetical protein